MSTERKTHSKKVKFQAALVYSVYGSGPQGRNPAGESPAVTVVRL